MSRLSALCLCVTVVASGCARELLGKDPPASGFYFPIGVAALSDIDPGQPWVYVLSSDFDLRFNAGWVSVVDARAAYDATTDDPDDIVVQQLKLPALGGELALGTVPDGRRVLVSAHRGTPKVAVMEIGDDGSLSCGNPNSKVALDAAGQLTDCDAGHLITILRESTVWNRQASLLVQELTDPYAVAVVTLVSTGQPVVVVGFISSGKVLVYDLDLDASVVLKPRAVIDTGNGGIGSLTQHPDPDHTFVVGTSRIFASDSRRSSLVSIDLDRALAEQEGGLRTSEGRGVSIVRLDASTGGQEIADLVFAPGGSRAFASDNGPDAIFVLDSSLQGFEQAQDDGTFIEALRPKYSLSSTLPQAGQPTGLAYLARPTGDVLAATSFRDDALFISSVAGDSLVLTRRLDNVATGPFAAAPVALPNGADLLFISSFFNHGLALVNVPGIDLSQTARLALFRNPDLGVATEQR